MIVETIPSFGFLRRRRGMCALLAALALSGCERLDSPAPPAAAPPLRVRTVPVERITAPRLQPVAGIVRPLERAVVAAKVVGTITAASFVLGQGVSAGEVLVTLSAPELKARVDQARASFEQAQRDATRETRLLAEGSSTAEAARTAEDRRRMAEAALEEAVTTERYTRVAAPFSGTVTRKLVNPGDFAVIGTPLFEVEATSRFRAEVEVPDTLPTVALGTELRVLAPDGEERGRVVEASRAADLATRTRSVRVELGPDTRMRSGQFVRVLWPAGDGEACFVPATAVGRFGQLERVFVVDGGRAQLRLIRTGRTDGNRIEVLSGLERGEAVIVSPSAQLRDGQAVQAEP